MKKGYGPRSRLVRFVCVFSLLFGILATSSGFSADAVNVILKNTSSAAVDVGLIDQYGGNFSATIDAGMAQSHTLKVNSPVTVGGNTVHTVVSADEGNEIVVAGQ